MMDIIIEFIWFTIEVFFWVIVFSFVFGVMGNLFANAKNEVDLQRQEFVKKLDEIVHRVNIEQYNGVYYWFDDDDGEFLGQGNTDDECIAHIRKRFPDHMFFFPNNRLVKGPDWTFQEYQVKQ